VVEFVVDIPHAWGLRKIPGHHYKVPLMVEVFDADGQGVRSQVCAIEDDSVYAYLKYGSAFNFDSSRVKIALDVEVPAMGWCSFKVVPRQAASRPVDLISMEPNVLENEFLRAEVKGDGTICLTDRRTGETFTGLHSFEDEGECGGPLSHVKPNEPALYTTLGQPAPAALVQNGPLLATFRIEREWLLPEELAAERKIHVPHGAEWVDHGALQRSSVKKAVKLTTEVTLRRGSARLEFVTTLENTVKDHRLRVVFPTGRQDAAVCHVDSPYDVVERTIAIPDSTGWYEAAARTRPTTSWVDVSDDGCGLAVIHEGLSEYEVTDNRQRAIALTLLRCFGTAGNPSETHQNQPLAQCQGAHIFRYAVLPHCGDWKAGGVTAEASRFNTPLRVAECTPHEGTLPQMYSFVSVDDERLVFSALKLAENGDGLILRGYNPTAGTIEVAVSLPKNISFVEQVTLEEEAIKTLEIKDGAVFLKIGKGEIVSLRLKT